MRAIQGNPQCIGDIFGHEFEIPEFQRPYSWERDECDQLWNDLSSFLDGADSGQEKYFLGSIVVYPKSSNEKVWCVIDGQQRLTTVLMLVAVLFERLATYTILKKMLYKQDPITGDAIDGEPRINSLVLTRRDRDALQEILKGNASALDKQNLFRLNYEQLREHLGKWWQNKSTEERDRIIHTFQNNIVMLPIQCSSEDDALTLFQIINDRGRPLNDSDIFKAKIYNAVPENERNGFMERWNNIDDHENLFRLYMHISRAEKKDTGKEIGLRKYMLDHHLKDQQALAQHYKNIMNALEACHWMEKNNSSSDNKIVAEENIYWGILQTYPNMYWQYPLYVFLNNHMERNKDGFDLPKKSHDEYLKLMKETARYVLIKGVVHNAVNTLKDTIFKVCVAIATGNDYVAIYRDNIDKKEIDRFDQKLRESDYGQRYRKGLILLNASLNPNQNRAQYGETIQAKIDIEHILPRAWNHYGKWTKDSHEQHINNPGNLMPLEKPVNCSASDEFFLRKQKAYEASSIQDALDLAKKHTHHWYPEDVQQRQEEALKRLRDFFQ